jgi:hypothetical protein
MTTQNGSLGAWHNLVVSYTASSGSASFYVDGSFINTATGLETSIANCTSAFMIGAQGAGGGSPAGYFNGSIDEVGVWSKALSDSEAESLYNLGYGFEYN